MAVHLILRDRYLHSVQWNGTVDTSSLRGNLDTGERPVGTQNLENPRKRHINANTNLYTLSVYKIKKALNGRRFL